MEEDKFGSDDEVSLPKPSREQIGQDHDQSGGAPGAVFAPSQPTSDLTDTTLDDLGRQPSPGTMHNPTDYSILSRGYITPPQQFPVDPYQQGMDKEHRTMYPFPLTGPSGAARLPQPAPTWPYSDDRHGAKRLLPPHHVDEHDKPAQKRRFHSPTIDIPNQPLLLGPNPNAHPIGRGVQPASIDVSGGSLTLAPPRDRGDSEQRYTPGGESLTLGPLGDRENLEQKYTPGGESLTLCPPGDRKNSEQIFTPGGESLTLGPPGKLENSEQRLIPGGESLTLAPPGNLESSEQRLNPGGESLTLGPPGNEQSELRQPPDPDTNLKL